MDGRMESTAADLQPQAGSGCTGVYEHECVEPCACFAIAIGRKNWLFIGEVEAGQRSAILFTIIEACRGRGIDPQTYLRDVLKTSGTSATGSLGI